MLRVNSSDFVQPLAYRAHNVSLLGADEEQSRAHGRTAAFPAFEETSISFNAGGDGSGTGEHMRSADDIEFDSLILQLRQGRADSYQDDDTAGGGGGALISGLDHDELRRYSVQDTHL
eukprot:m.91110 g.91110  ORF g.91110 m.91110 type:complete len:118 (-) comp8590_c0_seq1:73-426(-)